MKKNWSGERLETDVHGEFVSEHLHRYCIASNFVKDKVILDIASGEGYGSNLLAASAKSVIGVDIDQEAITKAKAKYQQSNLTFKTGSADKIPVDDHSIDVLISFETIEHHDKHLEMFSEIKRVLKSDGILIMSSPDKKYYTDIPNKINPFHVKELYLEEFEQLAGSNFKHVDVYLQRYIDRSSFFAPVEEFNSLLIYSGDFNQVFSQKLTPLYNIIIASDSPVSKVEKSLFDAALLTEKLSTDIVKSIHSSPTFKIGRVITYPFYKFKKIIKG
jgi:ubiquinone/menaquinone biosynthesis C-methylase UbiE